MSLFRQVFLLLCIAANVVALGQKSSVQTDIKKAASLEQSDPDAAAKLYLTSGKSLDESYKYDSAALLLIKARDLFRQRNPEGSLGESQSCAALGDVYKYEMYNFDDAEVNYERALSIQQRLAPTDLRTLTRLHYNLATTNRSQHDLGTAITWCKKALNGAEEMKDNAFIERAYSILGNVYRDMHQYDSAGIYYQKGVAVNYSINKGKQNETLAGLLVGLGDTFYRQKNLDEAAARLQQALSIYSTGVVDKSIHQHAIRLLAEVQITRKKMPEAYSLLTQGEVVRREIRSERGGPTSSLWKTFGDYHLAAGDLALAADYYNKAYQATSEKQILQSGMDIDVNVIDLKDYAYDALLGKADVCVASYLKDGKTSAVMDAIHCYVVAEKLMVTSRAELDTEDAKWNYVDANYQLYERVLAALKICSTAPDRDDKAVHSMILQFMENSKSKSLADALREVEMKKAVGNTDTLLQTLRTLRQQSLSLQHNISGKDDENARDQLIIAARAISQVEKLINEKYPSYLAAKYENASVPMDALRSKINSLDAAFIEYFWGANRVYAFVITADTNSLPGFYDLGKVDSVQSSLSVLAEIFRSKTNKYSENDVREFASAANDVYRFLLQPFEAKLQGRKRLVIVPDGPLMQVPFETLVTNVSSEGNSYNRLPYLLNDYIISYGFSGYYFAGERKAPTKNPRLLAFGFTGGRELRAADDPKVEIAGTETELLALSEKFPEGQFLFGDGVTEESFKKNAGSYDLLHLAVHGSGDVGEDYSATLYFRDNGGPEDGRLYWYELYNMNLRASLAVLSSCESGIGKTYKGEGMLSMANAFTFAGCSNIVMGLWKVDDQVSVKLMNTFYSELLNGMSIDEALALAKRTYLATADHVSANPKLWGSLVAFGEAPIVKPDEIHTGWSILALVVLISAIVVLYIKTKKKD